MKKQLKTKPGKRPASTLTRARVGSNLKTVLSETQIRRRVAELAAQINRDYRGKTLHVVGVLEDCFLFMGDLVRALSIPVVCYFVRPEVRETAPGGVPMREILYTPRVDAAGKDILLLDGILQSGVTLDHLYRYLLGQNPTSLRTATLIEKTDERKVAVATDYVGFKTSGKYLAGYGLAYQGKYRNLPRIVTVA
jgi:hypoxanthine phosphoribosyltransferase